MPLAMQVQWRISTQWWVPGWMLDPNPESEFKSVALCFAWMLAQNTIPITSCHPPTRDMILKKFSKGIKSLHHWAAAGCTFQMI